MRSKRGKFRLFAFIALSFLIANSALFADHKIEVSSSSGYTGNLYNDSSKQTDSYVMHRATLKLYPISTVELKLDGEYSHYAEIIDLISTYGNASITFIPTSEAWPVSVRLNGYINSRAYDDAMKDFNSSNYGVSISFGHSPDPGIQLRGGFFYKATNYPETEKDTTNLEAFDVSRDYDSYKLFFGFSMPVSSSSFLDFEISYEQMNLSFAKRPLVTDTFYNSNIRDFVRRDYLNPTRDSVIEGHYNVFYISPRLSRPIGSKTGINLTYVYSLFSNTGDIIIPRISNYFLSPWTAFWTGEAVSINVKSYLLPGFILNAGIGYWEKEFLQTEETRTERLMPSWVITTRYDEQRKRYFSIQKPIVIRGGTYIEPNVQIDYTRNDSSNDNYNYSHFSFAAGVTIRF